MQNARAQQEKPPAAPAHSLSPGVTVFIRPWVSQGAVSPGWIQLAPPSLPNSQPGQCYFRCLHKGDPQSSAWPLWIPESYHSKTVVPVTLESQELILAPVLVHNRSPNNPVTFHSPHLSRSAYGGFVGASRSNPNTLPLPLSAVFFSETLPTICDWSFVLFCIYSPPAF